MSVRSGCECEQRAVGVNTKQRLLTDTTTTDVRQRHGRGAHAEHTDEDGRIGEQNSMQNYVRMCDIT